jgi:putative ABC transport system substrate-binding protein
MRRRDVIALAGGLAAWPLTARAQQPERMRRIGVLMNRTADQPEGQTRFAAFSRGLQEAGWAVGRNPRIDIAGAWTMPPAFAHSRGNWSRLRQTLFWPAAL